MREEVIGRANVEDTPELDAYYHELAGREAGALWTVANEIEPWQPSSASTAVLWRYAEMRGPVLRSVELVTPEKAGRRVIYLRNPGRRQVAADGGHDLEEDEDDGARPQAGGDGRVERPPGGPEHQKNGDGEDRTLHDGPLVA